MTETPGATEQAPQQAEMPFAYVQGEALTTLPKDLYIPPDALEVFLEAFEGPLDLLLHLIRQNEVEITDIPVAQIANQYLDYIEMMRELRLDVAAEYLVMAASLALIKSRMLLPPDGEEEEGDALDPRAELVARLLEVAGRTDIPIGIGVQENENEGAQAEWVKEGPMTAAVEDGKFHVWSVDSIYDGVELLTGVPAGKWDEEKGWTENSVFAACQDRLDEMVGFMRQAAKGGATGTEPDANDAESPEAEKRD